MNYEKSLSDLKSALEEENELILSIQFWDLISK